MFARFRFFEPPNGKSFSHTGWLLCRKDVSTAMIYARVLNKGGRGVKSPLDRIEQPVG